MNKNIKILYWTLLALPAIAMADTIQNPLGPNVNTFADLVNNLATAVTEIAIPFVVIFLMYAGFLFVSARGNEKQLTDAKKIFYWTIIGAAIVVGASALAHAAVSFVHSLGNGGAGGS